MGNSQNKEAVVMTNSLLKKLNDEDIEICKKVRTDIKNTKRWKKSQV